MKKKICIFTIIFSLLILCISTCFAAETPIYDATYNGGTGAFYANGTEIVIDKDANNNTVISWNGGTQIVPVTVSVFGGGKDGATYGNSKIIMENGTVQNVVGGGISTNSATATKTNNTNITINGGTVTNNVVAGGYLYSSTQNGEITLNGGKVANILGGGMASIVIDGVAYSSGTEADIINSGTRVEKSEITINGGTVEGPSGYGTVFGGGQGYSYTGNTEITINAGDLSKTYVTASGSNGYTGSAKVNILGGKIKVYQSVNRGLIESTKILMTEGEVDSFYLGGETDDTGVNGIIKNIETDLLDGKINKLEVGTSNAEPIIVDNNKYKLLKSQDIEVTVNNIHSGLVDIKYSFTIYPNEIELKEEESKRIYYNLTTTPPGYEYLFQDNIKFECDNTEIAEIENSIVKGNKEGTAIITASLNNIKDTAIITVKSDSFERFVVGWIITFLILFVIVFILIIFILKNYKRKCRHHNHHDHCNHHENYEHYDISC